MPTPAPKDRLAVARRLNAIVDGSSPDEIPGLRRIILEQDEPVFGTIPMRSDDELVDAWQRGVYPYKNLMSRKRDEREQYHLQVELAQAPGVGQELRPARGDPVRGP